MSGTIAVSPEARWSAAGWLFDWTVGFLADHVTDPAVAAQLREIVDENLGWLSLADYGPDTEREIHDLLRHRLLPAATDQLPATIPNRPAALDLLRQLADLTGQTARRGP